MKKKVESFVIEKRISDKKSRRCQFDNWWATIDICGMMKVSIVTYKLFQSECHEMSWSSDCKNCLVTQIYALDIFIYLSQCIKIIFWCVFGFLKNIFVEFCVIFTAFSYSLRNVHLTLITIYVYKYITYCVILISFTHASSVNFKGLLLDNLEKLSPSNAWLCTHKHILSRIIIV